ncbi:Crp/Fnr family transcriptional regulator [Gaetbulibacter saemankumensis]|uniref:Crp/Fnr family transcriptional regulator n=1 Tax=Gaetbulibacter saemankumensis TaxID=311208 RepID=UPI00041F94C2|nr:Crp/Fnr family transcriptional regulator [Gaetbulibacter saemankumensis]
MEQRYIHILKLVNQISKIGSLEEQLIIDSFKPFNLKKGEYFLESGKINRHVAFLHSGLIRYFVYNNSDEATFEFTKEGEFLADYQSFNNKTPSLQNIQAIEDCEMLIISYSDLQNIFNKVSTGNLIGRIIIEHRFDIMVRQLLAIYMQGHVERYKSFVDNYSGLAQRIPQYHIASYVGVKPPSLSRIKKKFVKGIS